MTTKRPELALIGSFQYRLNAVAGAIVVDSPELRADIRTSGNPNSKLVFDGLRERDHIVADSLYVTEPWDGDQDDGLNYDYAYVKPVNHLTFPVNENEPVYAGPLESGELRPFTADPDYPALIDLDNPYAYAYPSLADISEPDRAALDTLRSEINDRVHNSDLDDLLVSVSLSVWHPGFSLSYPRALDTLVDQDAPIGTFGISRLLEPVGTQIDDIDSPWPVTQFGDDHHLTVYGSTGLNVDIGLRLSRDLKRTGNELQNYVLISITPENVPPQEHPRI